MSVVAARSEDAGSDDWARTDARRNSDANINYHENIQLLNRSTQNVVCHNDSQ